MTYEELLAENLRLRVRIRELEQENARLKGYGSSLLCEPEPPQYGRGPVRPERNRDAEIQRRLDIFRGLFRGREDVFAQRFVSSKTGKPGYQPVCKNRWSPECNEHKRKCEGCPFREFVPLDEAVIRRHLDKDAKDIDVIGIYPILEITQFSFFVPILMTRTASTATRTMSFHMCVSAKNGAFPHTLSVRVPGRAPMCGYSSKSQSWLLMPGV